MGLHPVESQETILCEKSVKNFNSEYKPIWKQGFIPDLRYLILILLTAFEEMFAIEIRCSSAKYFQIADDRCFSSGNLSAIVTSKKACRDRDPEETEDLGNQEYWCFKITWNFLVLQTLHPSIHWNICYRWELCYWTWFFYNSVIWMTNSCWNGKIILRELKACQ